jgi:hypothetical protein
MFVQQFQQEKLVFFPWKLKQTPKNLNDYEHLDIRLVQETAALSI